MTAMEMRVIDHDSKRLWIVGDDRGAVSIHAIIVPDTLRLPTVIRDPRGQVNLYPDCITYHTPVPGGGDAVSDCPALEGRWCEADAGGTAVHILMQWERLGYAEQYLRNTLIELHARRWPAVETAGE